MRCARSTRLPTALTARQACRLPGHCRRRLRTTYEAPPCLRPDAGTVLMAPQARVICRRLDTRHCRALRAAHRQGRPSCKSARAVGPRSASRQQGSRIDRRARRRDKEDARRSRASGLSTSSERSAKVSRSTGRRAADVRGAYSEKSCERMDVHVFFCQSVYIKMNGTLSYMHGYIHIITSRPHCSLLATAVAGRRELAETFAVLVASPASVGAWPLAFDYAALPKILMSAERSPRRSSSNCRCGRNQS